MQDTFETFLKFPHFAELTEKQGNIEALKYCLDVRAWKQRIKVELREILEGKTEVSWVGGMIPIKKILGIKT